MENRKLVYIFGILFSIAFACLYFFLFDTLIPKNDKDYTTIYFNQVGLYKDEENSEKTIAKLKEQQIDAYAIKKADVTAVVCGVSELQEETKKLQNTLDTFNIAYIEKNIAVDDPKILQLWKDKEIIKVLEMMNY